MLEDHISDYYFHVIYKIFLKKGHKYEKLMEFLEKEELWDKLVYYYRLYPFALDFIHVLVYTANYPFLKMYLDIAKIKNTKV